MKKIIQIIFLILWVVLLFLVSFQGEVNIFQYFLTWFTAAIFILKDIIINNDNE